MWPKKYHIHLSSSGDIKNRELDAFANCLPTNYRPILMERRMSRAQKIFIRSEGTEAEHAGRRHGNRRKTESFVVFFFPFAPCKNN